LEHDEEFANGPEEWRGGAQFSERLEDLYNEFARTRACFDLLTDENVQTHAGLDFFTSENVQMQAESTRARREPLTNFLPVGKLIRKSSFSFLPVEI
jgi:hypothetical protein